MLLQPSVLRRGPAIQHSEDPLNNFATGKGSPILELPEMASVVTTVASEAELRKIPFWKQGDEYMYMPSQLAARRRTRSDSAVLAALQAFWESVTYDPAHPPDIGRPLDGSENAFSVITKARYTEVFSRISQVLDPSVTADGAAAEAVAAWMQDTSGDVLTFFHAQWFDSIWELADICTRTCVAAEYATFIWELVKNVFGQEVASAGYWRRSPGYWRTPDAIVKLGCHPPQAKRLDACISGSQVAQAIMETSCSAPDATAPRRLSGPSRSSLQSANAPAPSLPANAWVRQSTRGGRLPWESVSGPAPAAPSLAAAPPPPMGTRSAQEPLRVNHTANHDTNHGLPEREPQREPPPPFAEHTVTAVSSISPAHQFKGHSAPATSPTIRARLPTADQQPPARAPTSPEPTRPAIALAPVSVSKRYTIHSTPSPSATAPAPAPVASSQDHPSPRPEILRGVPAAMPLALSHTCTDAAPPLVPSQASTAPEPAPVATMPTAKPTALECTPETRLPSDPRALEAMSDSGPIASRRPRPAAVSIMREHTPPKVHHVRPKPALSEQRPPSEPCRRLSMCFGWGSMMHLDMPLDGRPLEDELRASLAHAWASHGLRPSTPSPSMPLIKSRTQRIPRPASSPNRATRPNMAIRPNMASTPNFSARLNFSGRLASGSHILPLPHVIFSGVAALNMVQHPHAAAGVHVALAAQQSLAGASWIERARG